MVGGTYEFNQNSILELSMVSYSVLDAFWFSYFDGWIWQSYFIFLYFFV